MSRFLASIDRIIALLLGLILIALGAWSIGLHFNEANSVKLTEYISKDGWLSASGSGWFQYALIAAVILGALLGIALLIANLRTRNIKEVNSKTSSENGSVEYRINQIASAAGDTIENSNPRINNVRSNVAYDRRRPTMSLVVDAEGKTDITTLVDTLTTTDYDIREATENRDLDIIYKIRLNRLN